MQYVLTLMAAEGKQKHQTKKKTRKKSEETLGL